MAMATDSVRLRSELDDLTRAVGGPIKPGKVLKGIMLLKERCPRRGPLQGIAVDAYSVNAHGNMYCSCSY